MYLHDVGAVQTDKLRSAEPASESQEEECPIPCVLNALAYSVKYQDQILLKKRLRLVPRGPVPSLDAPQRGADDFRSAGVGETLRRMSLRDRGHTSNQRRDAQCPSMGGEVQRHDLRSRRDTSSPHLELR